MARQGAEKRHRAISKRSRVEAGLRTPVLEVRGPSQLAMKSRGPQQQDRATGSLLRDPGKISPLRLLHPAGVDIERMQRFGVARDLFRRNGVDFKAHGKRAQLGVFTGRGAGNGEEHLDGRTADPLVACAAAFGADGCALLRRGGRYIHPIRAEQILRNFYAEVVFGGFGVPDLGKLTGQGRGSGRNRRGISNGQGFSGRRGVSIRISR